ANREEMPEDIRSAIPYIYKIIEAFNIKTYGLEGYEADDIIGTLAKKAEKDGFTTYMMTPDKDYAQLVSDNIFMYRPAKAGKKPEIWGIPEVQEKFGVQTPEQVIDFLGMMGDKVDNIPGIPGVGEKRAKDLISEFGSMEGLYENLDKLKGKLKENVEQNQEQAMMSKKLARIILEVPVDWEPEACARQEPNKELLRELFGQLEFRTLSQRVLGEKLSVASSSGTQTALFGEEPAEEEEVQSSLKSIEDVEHNYQLLQGKEGLETLLEILQSEKVFCFDTETTDLDPWKAELLGLAVSTQKGSGYYLALEGTQEEKSKFLEPLKAIFTSDKHQKIAHNLKFDSAILANYGIAIKDPVFDTMVAHYLINPDMRHGMDALAEAYLNYQPISIEELIGKKGKGQKTMEGVELEKVAVYAAEDADITFQLYQDFKPKLAELKAEKLFHELEMPLVDVLRKMEHEGIRLDVEMLKLQSEKLVDDIKDLEASIYKHAGTEFLISSPKQLGEILFDRMKITEKAKKTKSGQYATGEDVLAKLKDEHPIVEDILSYRQLQKLKSTYVDALPQLVNQHTGRIHTSFNQTVASTGRLSSNNPNLQNIPIRTERGREIRTAFVPRDENHILVAADYSQVELRIIAALAKDENMMQAFKDKLDIHAATAARVFGVKMEDVNREQRSRAKAVNFGIIYGQSAFTLADQLGIKRGEARDLIDNYFTQYPAIKEFLASQKDLAKEQGYVETIMGRRRYLPDINSKNAVVRGFAERNAVNAPIQGSAADIIKKAMIDIQNWLEKEQLKSKMILQVHDELLFDTHKDEKEIICKGVQRLMENAVKLDVPLEVEVGIGNNWLEAH
ncbi:MAG: DNA polymerase I, partial [Luteibaculum sp.]